jgi:hypothetical protein
MMGARLSSSERQTPSPGFQPSFLSGGGLGGGGRRGGGLSTGAAVVLGIIIGALAGAVMGLAALGGDALLRGAGTNILRLVFRGAAGGGTVGAALGFLFAMVTSERSIGRVIGGMLGFCALLALAGIAGAAGTTIVAGWLGWALGGAAAGAGVGVVVGVIAGG